MALLSTQKLPMYSSSSSSRAKLTLPQDVVGKIPMLFPPELQNSGEAELIIFVEGRRLPFAVTASLQKQGENGRRVVLLESGWKPVVRELRLRQGDTVSIFLSNNTPWTYSIEVERIEIDLNHPPQPDWLIDLNQPAQP